MIFSFADTLLTIAKHTSVDWWKNGWYWLDDIPLGTVGISCTILTGKGAIPIRDYVGLCGFSDCFEHACLLFEDLASDGHTIKLLVHKDVWYLSLFAVFFNPNQLHLCFYLFDYYYLFAEVCKECNLTI